MWRRAHATTPIPEWRKDHQGDSATFNAAVAGQPAHAAGGHARAGLPAGPGCRGHAGRNARCSMRTRTTGNLFLAESAVRGAGAHRHAGGRGGARCRPSRSWRTTRNFTRWYGDHDALDRLPRVTRALPHHRSARRDGLDAGRQIVPHLIRSRPDGRRPGAVPAQRRLRDTGRPRDPPQRRRERPSSKRASPFWEMRTRYAQPEIERGHRRHASGVGRKAGSGEPRGTHPVAGVPRRAIRTA